MGGVSTEKRVCILCCLCWDCHRYNRTKMKCIYYQQLSWCNILVSEAFSIYENAPHILCFGSWGLNAAADLKIQRGAFSWSTRLHLNSSIWLCWNLSMKTINDLFCRKRQDPSHRLGPSHLSRKCFRSWPLHSQPVEGRSCRKLFLYDAGNQDIFHTVQSLVS